VAEQAVIEIRGLVKAYGFLPVLRKLDLDIERGKTVMLLGPNGSGKSTLMKLIAGLNKPTAGTIRVGGWEIPREADAVRAQIGMVSHQSLLYGNLTAEENLRFFGSLYNLPKADLEARIPTLLKQVGLGKRARSIVRTFSRGMQQRLSIARALLHEPHVLLFDEPYTGLDQDAARILDGLLQSARDDGHTVLIATHQLERAAQNGDRAVILSRGSIGYDAPITDIDGYELAAIYTDVTGAAVAR